MGEWGQPEPRGPGAPAWARFAVVALAVAFAVGAVGWVSVAPAVGVALAIACVALWAGWVWIQPRRALAALGPGRAGASSHARLDNIVHGLARDLGLPEPLVVIAADGHANAITSHVRRPAFAISERFLDRLTRTELEAVTAHCLLRARRDVVRGYAMRAALGRIAGTAGGTIGRDDDLRTVALTRYPPALASALAKAEPASGRLEPFFFAGRDVDARRRALADL